ncbi:tRNA (guanine(26)-N(2))-dimethyltransferase [Candidatus Woesearchaeota archaeon]|nr:tRNA (guanine(26)-N(2))-dimethyltransferase [Candidatus Woesearchaeota archaeon]
MQTKEGKALIKANKGKISKKLTVFYNPDMELNRTISILLLNSINLTNLRIALPLAGSGIRGIRFLLELNKNKIQEIHFNDANPEALEDIKFNLELNNLNNNQSKHLYLSNKEANKFLLESDGFDYIDIDPFGSPNPFLDTAIKRISRNGILAVTATDTAPLSGTYPKTCLRKYWALPLRNELKHEIGLRILIRKIQLIGAQYDKALIPILSFWNLHYFRIFFQCNKGKKKVDEIIKQHAHLECNEKSGEFSFSEKSGIGPLWSGDLFDSELISEIKSGNNLVQLIKQESRIKSAFFYDIHQLCKKHKLRIPKKDCILNLLKEKGYTYSETHFNVHAIKSEIPFRELINLLKSLQ